MSELHKISGCNDADRKADVVFIHGLGGDAFATWRNENNAETDSWPYWLGKEFPDVGIWSLSYAASATKWGRLLRLFRLGSRDSGYSMALPNRALQTLDLMVQNGVGERPLLFICHSLGGLLAKQILRKSDDAINDLPKQQVATHTRAVLFLATPHAGAHLASLVSAFRAVFGATVSIEDLRAHDAHLSDLYDWYRNHAPMLQIETRTYFESRPVKGILPIVNPTSAHPGVGADPVGLDDDHLSIAKPRDRGAQVCGSARDLLKNHVLAAPPKAPDAGVAAFPSSGTRHEVVVKLDAGMFAADRPPRIPREMPPAAHQFFGRAAERKQLTDRLRAGLNTAVVGPAGLGKTALAAAALEKVAGVGAANLAASPFPDGVVYLDLYSLHGQAEPAWNTLANRICGAAFMERSLARDRATEACRGRQILVVIEGGEEADGNDGRATIAELFSVLSPENRWLLLTRINTQAAMEDTVSIEEALHLDKAAGLLDGLTKRRKTPLSPDVRQTVLELLAGHPLALTWAGNLLARDEEDPAALASDWKAEGLPQLSDPMQAPHTLLWLFERSVRGVDDTARGVLAAAGSLANVAFPSGLMVAAIGGGHSDGRENERVRQALKGLAQRGLLRREESGYWQFTHVLAYRFAREEHRPDAEQLQRLGFWLADSLIAELKSGPITEQSPAVRNLQHADALLRGDAEQLLWDPLVEGLLYDIAGRLEEIGRLDLVTAALNAVEVWLGQLPEDKTGQPFWRCQHYVLVGNQGDVLREQGDLAGALTAFREVLTVMQRLAEADPSNAGWQRDLSVSQERIGDVLREQGDLAGALTAFREVLAVRRRLAEADPSNAVWQRDLSVSHNKVGDVLRDQGDLAGALTAFRESLAVRRRLAEADPSNAEWQRDLSVSHNKVGDVLCDQGDLAGALTAFRESLAVSQRLAGADPSNAERQRDLSVSQGNIGDMLREQGDLAGALTAFREVLTVMQRLAEADPSNARWQRDLSVSHNKVGDVLRDQGDLAGALTAFRESLAVSRRLAGADPSNAGWQRDLSVSHNKVGDVLRDQGDLAGALTAFCESLAVSRRLAETDPSNARWQRDLSVSLTRLAQLHEKRNELAAALPFAQQSLLIDERLSALDPTNAIWRRDLAVSCALVARLGGGTQGHGEQA